MLPLELEVPSWIGNDNKKGSSSRLEQQNKHSHLYRDEQACSLLISHTPFKVLKATAAILSQ